MDFYINIHLKSLFILCPNLPEQSKTKSFPLPVPVQAERTGEEKPQQEPQTPVGGQEWPNEFLSDTPVLCQQSGGKPGVTFTSARGEVFSVLEWAPGGKWGEVKLTVKLQMLFCVV